MTDIFSLPWDSQSAELTESDIAELREHKDEIEALINAHAAQTAQTTKTE